jgi:group II intron reverse transcriptase/maturase
MEIMSVHCNDGIRTWSTKLKRIGELSAANKSLVFNNLGHIVDAEMLRDMYERLDGKKAIGIDGMTKEAYGQELEANLADLMRRIRRGTYRPQPARIVEIPKEDGSNRPLAIACVEDKLVQLAVSAILNAIYEPLFLPCSYGFRPNRGCHDALKALSQSVFQVRDGAIVEIDLRKYFNSIPHEPMLDMLRAKISDGRFVWLLETLLRAPTIDTARIITPNECGSPQGPIVSPVLSNIYLHHVVDEWFAEINREHFVSDAWEIRYADDMAFVFKSMTDAERFYRVLDKRLNKFGIELHKEKSQLLPAGTIAASRANAEGKRIPTFKFLGFTWYWGLARKKQFWRLKLKSRSDRKRAKLNGLREYLRDNLNTPDTAGTLRRVVAGVRGWVKYHAVSDNQRAVSSFIMVSSRIVFNWFNRRGRKHAMNWERFEKVLAAIGFPKVPHLVRLYPTPNRR